LSETHSATCLACKYNHIKLSSSFLPFYILVIKSNFCGIFDLMRIKLLLFFMFISFCLAKSQAVFQKTYGKVPQDYAYAMQKTFDGGCIISGVTNSYGGNDCLYLLKTDAQGDTLWVRGYNTNGIIYGNSIQQTTDSGYVVAGNNGILKTDALGRIIWGFTYTGVQFYSVQQTSDSGYIISGTVGSSGSSNGIDVYLLKLNTNGIKLWSKKLGGAADDVSTCIRQTSDGGYVSLGCTNSFGAGNTDIYLVKTNSNGDTLWTKTYGGPGSDGGTNSRQNLEITSDNGFIIGSFSNSFGVNGTDAYLIKTNATGDTLWTKTYGGTGSEVIYNVNQAHDGGYIFTGYTNSFGAGNNDVYVVKTNALGDTLWTRAFGGINNDLGQSVVEASDKGYLIAGYTNSFGSGNNDVLLIKTDSLGNSSCNQFNTSSIISSTPTKVGQTVTGKIFITLNMGSLNPTSKRGGLIKNACALNEIQSFEKQNFSLNVFPNPNSGVFTLSLNEKYFGKIKININTILGETIYNATQENNTVVDLTNMPNGIYFLKAETDKIFVERIIINK